MNYIKRLEQENKELKARVQQMELDLRALKAVALHHPKFTGVDIGGERKDWMSTGELTGHLDYILAGE